MSRFGAMTSGPPLKSTVIQGAVSFNRSMNRKTPSLFEWFFANPLARVIVTSPLLIVGGG
jgi:hypothetical protein